MHLAPLGVVEDGVVWRNEYRARSQETGVPANHVQSLGISFSFLICALKGLF